jgi:hypothetical protein
MWKMFVTVFALAASVQAQPLLPERGVQIIQAIYAQHPDLARGDDDQRRMLTRFMIEQFVCEFPNDGYTGKSADPNRPFSKDSIARLYTDKRLYSWDWQDGTSRRPMVFPNMPPTHDITGQNPMPVSCVNHLVPDVLPDVIPAPPDNPAIADAADRLAALYAEFQLFKREVREQWVVIEARDERIFANESAQVQAVAVSLEAHREEARKARSQVLAWVGNWRNLLTIAGGIVTGIVGSR